MNIRATLAPCFAAYPLLFLKDTLMNFDNALSLAARGEFLTRSSFGGAFLALRDGKIMRGRFIGETNLTEMKAYTLSKEDRRATDWTIFHRVLPDAWEGCDAPLEHTQS